MTTVENLSKAGDVQINEVAIITSRGAAISVTPQVIGIELYEDLFGSFISGKLTMFESIDLTNVLPLIGEEFVRVSFKTPTIHTEYSYDGEFFIYKMAAATRVNERAQVYELYFISKEAVLDLNGRISKCFSGKVSDIADEVISSLLGSNKTRTIEPTINSTKFISNYWTPTQNLQYLAEQAVNDNNSPSYLFFENKFGLNFVSLDSLYATSVVQRFIWDNYSADMDNNGSRRNIQRDYQRVLDIDTPETYDYVKRLKSGMYGSEMITYDLLTRQITHTAYSPNFEDGRHLNPNPLWANLPGTASPNAVLLNGSKYYYNFEGYGDVSNTSIIQKRKSLLAQAQANKVIITVFGRSDYSVGQKVYLDIPKTAQITSTSESKDNIMSGVYIISAICHMITRKSYECSIELIKDSYLVDING